jgi:pyruvate dehydrogenase E2 component (dihydrolipoamide acetyltransferase)
MATKVTLPKQGLQMTEGNIMQWLAKEGDDVKEGEPLFEMETDKLTIEIDAPATGKLLKIIHGEGAVVPITHIIGVIGEEGEDISDILAEAEAESGGDGAEAGGEGESAAAAAAPGESGGAAAAAPSPSDTAAPAEAAPPTAGGATSFDRPSGAAAGAPTGTGERRPDGQVFSTPRARLRAEERGIDLEQVAPSGPEGTVIERDVLAAAEAQPAATPLAKKAATAEGVPLSAVQGTGPRGKVYERDVAAGAAAGAAAAGAAAAGGAPGAAAAPREDRLVPLTGMRRTIAQRMRESLDTAAQAVHRLRVDMSETVRMRSKLKEAEIAVSYNDIILKATAQALREHPRMNSVLTDQGVLEYGRVDIGVAVALDEGLIVPKMRNVDLLSLQQIHAESRRLGEAARSGQLSGDEMQGGTFSVSNLGMYGLDSFTAIIDSPESGILAVGAIKDQVVPIDGQPEVRPMCELSLTYDHRVIDGAPAADFLRSIGRILENPYTLI